MNEANINFAREQLRKLVQLALCCSNTNILTNEPHNNIFVVWLKLNSFVASSKLTPPKPPTSLPHLCYKLRTIGYILNLTEFTYKEALTLYSLYLELGDAIRVRLVEQWLFFLHFFAERTKVLDHDL